MIQYEDQGPEARESRRPFIGASDGHWVLLLLHRVRCSHSTFEIHDGHSTIRVHRCGDHTALLSGGLTPPSVMPIDSPHESASGGNENSSGDPLSRGLLGLAWVVSPPRTSTSSPSQQNVALAFLFAIPA